MPNAAAEDTEAVDALVDLHRDQLEDEKTRNEIGKLRIEIQELQAWKSKLIFTGTLAILAPLGSIILFLTGWFGSHSAERMHQNEELYNHAAAQLSSADASVRLSAVSTLDHFAHPGGSALLGRLAERAFTDRDSRLVAKERPREAMALLIGRLPFEDDQAVLDAIAREVAKYPEESVTPLVSMNKTEAVAFARAAGQFSGLSILARLHRRSAEQDDLPGEGTCDESITDIANAVLRTGSPFEASLKSNQQFSPRDFLTNPHYPFRELFQKQQRLALSSDMSTVLRDHPPTSSEVSQALQDVLAAAAKLERSSYILGSAVNQRSDLFRSTDLYGTAVVVGDFSPEAIQNLVAQKVYVQSPETNQNWCDARPTHP